MGRKFHMVKIS